MVLALATVVVAVALAWRDGFTAISRAPLAGRVALLGIAVLPLLQLIPLPPALWQELPGQELRRATLDLVGLGGSWQPMTLEPASTALSAVLAIGFVAFVGWLLRLSETDFRHLLLVAFTLVLLAIVSGLLQVVSDGQFPQLQATNMGATMIGFFANKNHMALILACSILLFGIFISQTALTAKRRHAAVIGYLVFALVCIVTTNSRAGLGLGLLASAFVLADLARGMPLKWRVGVVALIVLLAVLVMSSSAFEVVSGRVEDVGDDLRWRIATWSWPLAERYGLLGSGIGGFKTLFAANEQLSWVKPTFVNAAHNDYLQLVIECGLPGVVLLGCLIASLVGSFRAFRALAPRNPHRREIALGLAILALFAIHSAVDYPLRRPAAWAFFALALVAVYRGQSAVKAAGVQGVSAKIEAA